VKAVSAGVDRSAGHAGKAGVEKKLPADDHEDPGSTRVEGRGVLDSVKVASPQGMT
jgi:hypothetical protein